MSEPWQSELLKALQQLGTPQDGDGLTTAEIANLTGWSIGLTDRRMRLLFLAGKIETCRKMQPTRAGNYHSVPAYRIKA